MNHILTGGLWDKEGVDMNAYGYVRVSTKEQNKDR